MQKVTCMTRRYSIILFSVIESTKEYKSWLPMRVLCCICNRSIMREERIVDNIFWPSLQYLVVMSDVSFQLKSWNQLFWPQLLLFQSFYNCAICANSWVFQIVEGQSNNMTVMYSAGQWTHYSNGNSQSITDTYIVDFAEFTELYSPVGVVTVKWGHQETSLHRFYQITTQTLWKPILL